MSEVEISGEERRLQVQTYYEWARVAKGKLFPTLKDMDEIAIPGFRDSSFLLNVGTEGDGDEEAASPHFAFVGDSLLFDCDQPGPITQLADVPNLSLLSRLTDRYLQCVANRAPVGFEASFVNRQDHALLYRGILLPVSSNGEDIDFVWGTMNFKDTTDGDAPQQKRLPAKARKAGKRKDAKPADAPEAVAGAEAEPEELVLTETMIAAGPDEAPAAEARAEPDFVASLPPFGDETDRAAGIAVLERPFARPAPAITKRNSTKDAAEQAAPIHKQTEDLSKTTHNRSNGIMSIESKLAECMEIDGAIAVALVDGSSGMAIATGGNPRNLDLNVAAAGSCNVLKAKQQTLKELGLDEEIEDILITLTSQYHLLRPLTDASGKGLSVYLILDKAKGNLAMARFKLSKIEKDLTV